MLQVIRRTTLAAAVMAASAMAMAGIFDPPSTTSLTQQITGTTPSGLDWSAVATGTALPIRSTGTADGQPGAVAYWNVHTGLLQIDPRGWDISLFNFTYTTGTSNTTGATPGPLTYASGTSPTSVTVSGATGLANQRTLPAGTWTLVTPEPARLAGVVSLTASPTLTTSYDPGNGASTTGWFNQPWAFPANLVQSGSIPLMINDSWKVFGVSGNANANILGYGNYQGVFQYVVNGVTGNQVGAVVPVVVPEPSSLILIALAACGSFGVRWRKRRKSARKNPRETTRITNVIYRSSD